ncbi:hypothetical protein PENTCL1PPCAC_30732, partial [Pristionchus entomophagus]
FDDLMSDLEARLYSDAEIDLLKDELKALKQGGRSVHLYADEVRRSAEKAYPGSTEEIGRTRDREARENFITGLDDSIRLDVRKAAPQSFQQCVRTAQQMESVNRKEKKDQKIDTLIDGVNALLTSNSRQQWNRQPQSSFQRPFPQYSGSSPQYYRGNYNSWRGNYRPQGEWRGGYRGQWRGGRGYQGNFRGNFRGNYGYQNRGQFYYRGARGRGVYTTEQSEQPREENEEQEATRGTEHRKVNGVYLSSILSISMLVSLIALSFYGCVTADSDFHRLQICHHTRGGIYVRPPPLEECSYNTAKSPIIRTSATVYVKNSTIEELEGYRCSIETVEFCSGHFLFFRAETEKKIISYTAPTKEQCTKMKRDLLIDNRQMKKTATDRFKTDHIEDYLPSRTWFSDNCRTSQNYILERGVIGILAAFRFDPSPIPVDLLRCFKSPPHLTSTGAIRRKREIAIDDQEQIDIMRKKFYLFIPPFITVGVKELDEKRCDKDQDRELGNMFLKYQISRQDIHFITHNFIHDDVKFILRHLLLLKINYEGLQKFTEKMPEFELRQKFQQTIPDSNVTTAEEIREIIFKNVFLRDTKLPGHALFNKEIAEYLGHGADPVHSPRNGTHVELMYELKLSCYEYILKEAAANDEEKEKLAKLLQSSTTLTSTQVTILPSTTIIPSTTILPSTTIFPSTTILPSTTIQPSTTIFPSTTTPRHPRETRSSTVEPYIGYGGSASEINYIKKAYDQEEDARQEQAEASLNQKMSFANYVEQDAARRNFNTILYSTCRVQHQQLGLLWRFMQLDATLGVRSALGREDITARMVGVNILLINKCSPVEARRIYKDHKLNGSCYEYTPVETVTDDVLFIIPGSRDLTRVSPTVECGEQIPIVYEDDERFYSQELPVNVSTLPGEKMDSSPILTMIDFKSPGFYESIRTSSFPTKLAVSFGQQIRSLRLQQIKLLDIIEQPSGFKSSLSLINSTSNVLQNITNSLTGQLLEKILLYGGIGVALMTKIYASGRLAKYQIQLLEYNLKILYRRGRLNVVADALSRFTPDEVKEPLPDRKHTVFAIGTT